jgi:transposase
MKLRRKCKLKYAQYLPVLVCYNTLTSKIIIINYAIIKKQLDNLKKYGIIILTLIVVFEEVPMVKPRRNDPKEKALQDSGAWNNHPVTDALFRDNDFFDSRDLVQVKYEMLRRVHTEGEPVSRATAAFGFSRPSFYKSSSEFEREGVTGLLPRKRGPRSGHKLTAEVLTFAEGLRKGAEPAKIQAILDVVETHFGIRVHRRSLERALRPSVKKTLLGPEKEPKEVP